jgi:uncharacterized protein DUF2637
MEVMPMGNPTRPESTGSQWRSDRRAAAREVFAASVAEKAPLGATALGERFDMSRRWAYERIAEVRSQLEDGSSDRTELPVNGNGHRDGDMAELVHVAQPAVAATAGVRRVTTLAVVAVAAVAAIASYDHQRLLAEMAGEGWRAWALPISVDGLVLAASMTMLVRRRAGLAAGGLAWTALLLGGAASVFANVAAADPTAVGRVVAAWPPVALLISYELLLQQVRSPRRG